MKGHFAENWTYPFDYDYPILVQPTNSEYTVASYSLNHRYVEGQMDFQVEAMMGYFHRIPSPWAPWVFNGTESGWSNTQTITIPDIQVFSASTPAPTPTFSPTVTPTLAPYNTPTAASNNAPLFGLGLEQIAIVAFVIIAIVVLVAAVFLRRKTVKTQA
jgi:hypothetical protein